MKLKWTILFFSLVILTGCDFAANVGVMMEKMEQVNNELKTELNMDAQVGWNIHNGTLTQVTVLLPPEDVGDKTVRQLKDLTYPIVQRHFDEEPEVFQLIVAFPNGH